MYKYLKKAISIACALPMIGSSLGGYQTAFCQDSGISENQNDVGISANNTIPTKLFGFKLVQNLTHNNYPVLVYKHEKTGAQVCIEKNNYPNKQFSICFRTPAENDKGTNHVIEHCILNGSEKYPLKNITTELSKSSYSTTINGYFSQDCTCFPVSSLDEDELNSLAYIYVDSVFNPEFLKNEKIFKKEGIRYGLGVSNELTVNGTVFNEQIGKFTSIQCMLHDNIEKDLCPDTQKKFYLGGYPTDIMDLTYDEVCKTYKKYYHPSNCMFCMSGDINYAKFLEWIDSEYLSKYDKKEMGFVNYNIHSTPEKDSFIAHEYYANEKSKSSCFANITYILQDEEYKNSDKWEKLCDLLNDPDSLRVKEIEKKGYTDISAKFSQYYVYQPNFSIDFKAPKDRIDLMTEEKIKETMDEFLLKNPITQNEVDHHIKYHNFSEEFDQINRIDDPSLHRSDLLTSFTKYGTPCSDKYFDFNAIIDDNSNRDITASEYNDLLQSSLNNKRYCIIVHTPSNNKNLQIQEQINKKLKSKDLDKDYLTRGYIEQNIWSDTPNSQEDIQKLKKMFKPFADIDIPKLQLTVGNSPIIIGQSIDRNNLCKIAEKPCCIAEINMGKFSEYKITFNTNHISKDRINYLRLFSNLFGKLNTNQYSKEDLIDEKAGKVKFGCYIRDFLSEKRKLNHIFVITATTTKDNINKSFELLKEQLFHTNYSDIKNIRTFIDHNINSPDTEYNKFLKNIKENIDNKEFMDNLKIELENIRDSVINQSSYDASGICCASLEMIGFIKNEIADLINNMPIGNVNIIKDLDADPPRGKDFIEAPAKKILIDPSEVNNTISQTINIGATNDDASWDVFNKIVLTNYLSPKIREQGGAYEIRMDNDGRGMITLYSSYDPNLLSTLDAFSSIQDFINNLELTQHEVDTCAKSVVGNILPFYKTDFAFDEIFSIIYGTENLRESTNKRIDQLKSTTPEKIKKCAKILKNAIDNNQSTIDILVGKISPKERQLLQDQGFEIVESSSK